MDDLMTNVVLTAADVSVTRRLMSGEAQTVEDAAEGYSPSELTVLKDKLVMLGVIDAAD